MGQRKGREPFFSSDPEFPITPRRVLTAFGTGSPRGEKVGAGSPSPFGREGGAGEALYCQRPIRRTAIIARAERATRPLKRVGVVKPASRGSTLRASLEGNRPGGDVQRGKLRNTSGRGEHSCLYRGTVLAEPRRLFRSVFSGSCDKQGGI